MNRFMTLLPSSALNADDPIIGTLTDKTHTRWGRFRPWLLFGAPVTAIVLMLTF